LNRTATPPKITLFIIRAIASAASFEEVRVFMDVSFEDCCISSGTSPDHEQSKRRARLGGVLNRYFQRNKCPDA
jgi:hypothetical protein